jgi:conjugal transfer pilus assembly protein TraV
MTYSFRLFFPLSILGLGFLGGCSTTSETFDCQAGKGVGCKSISQINKMVNEDGLGGDAEKGAQSMGGPSSIPIMSGELLKVEPVSIPFSDEMVVHRIQEEHLRVWIAPFQDEQGNLHEGSVVHTVLKPGFWQIKPADSEVAS